MTTPPSLQAFVINLDRSTDRLAAMQSRLARAQVDWQRVPGVEGRLLDINRCAEVDVPGYRRWHGKELNPAEVGCYLSHIKAMRLFLAGPWSHALLLEDDADFPTDFHPLLQALLAKADQWDIVKLSCFHSGTPVAVADLIAPYALAVPLSRHMNANCIVFNRRAAQTLVDKLLPMRLPYDHALERAWLFGLRLRVVTPTPCPSETGLTSTIGDHPLARIPKPPVWQRLPAMGFRLRTELLRGVFGLFHIARAKLGLK